MNCEDVRANIIDALEKTRTRQFDAAVNEHLNTCSSCREELRDLNHIWDELGKVPAPKLNPKTASAMLERIRHTSANEPPDAATRLSPGAALRKRMMAIAALLVAALGGAVLSRSPVALQAFPIQVSDATTSIEPDIPTLSPGGAGLYLFLLHRPTPPIPPNRADRYQEWADNLRASNRLVRAGALQSTTGWMVTGGPSGMNATPLPAPTGDVEGFFLISARDSVDVIEAVRVSPHLDFGGAIEVRRVIN